MNLEDLIHRADSAHVRAMVGTTTNAERRAAEAEVTTQFRKDLEVFCGVTQAPTDKLEKLWSYAWREGHSEGYYSVAYIYRDLSELVRGAAR